MKSRRNRLRHKGDGLLALATVLIAVTALTLFGNSEITGFAVIDNVSGCRALSTEGDTYELNQSFSPTISDTNCLRFEADNTVLDCKGFEITYTMSNSGAKNVFYASNRNNITIKNCILTGSGGSDGYDNTALFNDVNGSYFYNNTITQDYAASIGVALKLVSSNRNNATNNSLTIGNIGLESSSNDNSIYNNRIVSQLAYSDDSVIFVGIRLDSSSRNNISANDITALDAIGGTGYDQFGIIVNNANENRITSNKISALASPGFGVIAKGNNTVIDLNNITAIGIAVNLSGTGNNITNNNVNSTANIATLISGNLAFIDGNDIMTKSSNGAHMALSLISNSSTISNNIITSSTTGTTILGNSNAMGANNITSTGISIHLTGTSTNITSGYINSTQNIAIFLTTTSNSTLLSSNTISSNSTNLAHSAINISSGGNTLLNNTITSRRMGVVLGANDNKIGNNTITSGTRGLIMESSGNNISLNVITSTTTTSIDSTGSNNLFNSNTLEGLTTIWSKGASNNITNNILRNNSLIEADFHIMSGNTMTGAYGFDIRSNNNTISNNTANTGNTAILITGNQNNITNNFLNGTFDPGLDIESNLNRITDNTIIGHDWTALYVSGFSGNSFVNNTIQSTNAEYGYTLWTTAAQNNTFYGNTLLTELVWIFSESTSTGNNYTATNFSNTFGSIISGLFNPTDDSLINTSNLNISNRRIFVNVSAIPFINVSSSVVITGVNFTYAEAKYSPLNNGNYIDCPSSICSSATYSGSTFSFTASQPLEFSVELTDNGVIGNLTDVTTTGVTTLNLTINNTYNLSKQHQLNQSIALYDGSTQIVNFTRDFSASALNLSQITIQKTQTGLITTLGQQLPAGHKKTISIADTGGIALCAKDAEINSLSEISSACTEENETDFTACIGNSDGITTNGITCTDTGTIITIQNLNHSGVKWTFADAEDESSGTSSSGSATPKRRMNTTNTTQIETTPAKEEIPLQEESKQEEPTGQPEEQAKAIDERETKRKLTIILLIIAAITALLLYRRAHERRKKEKCN